MIRFSVARVEKEPVELVGDEPAEWLEIEPSDLLRVTSPVHYDLLAKAVSGGVLVEGKVRTGVAGLCGRCLEPVAETIENPGVCLFYEQPQEDELDITEDVRGEMLLELPMNLLCSEECRGLCPHRGKNLNRGSCSCTDDDGADDRWSALDNLKL